MPERLKTTKLFALGLLEEASSAHLYQGRKPQDLIHTALDLRHKQGRIIAGMNLLGYVFPGFEERFTAKFLSPKKLPIKGVEPVSLCRNGENTIFLAHPVDSRGTTKPMVVKVNRESLLTDCVPMEIATRIHGEYEQIRKWYSALPGFVQEEQTFTAHSHLLGLPAVVTTQSFIPGKMSGIFEDYTEDTLVARLSGDEGLKRQFVSFARTTIEIHNNTGKCIDLAGERNVVIAEHEETSRLVLLDPHTIYSEDHLDEFDPALRQTIKEKIGHSFDFLFYTLSKLDAAAIQVQPEMPSVPVYSQVR